MEDTLSIMLDQEIKYFSDNKEKLLKNYKDKFLVIKDQEVKESFNSEAEAYIYASENFELGSFLIRQCLPGEQSYTQHFGTRVIF